MLCVSICKKREKCEDLMVTSPAELQVDGCNVWLAPATTQKQEPAPDVAARLGGSGSVNGDTLHLRSLCLLPIFSNLVQAEKRKQICLIFSQTLSELQQQKQS